MDEDGVLLEARGARDAYALSPGYDVRAIVADLRKRGDQGDWPVVRLVPCPARERRMPEASRSGDDEGRS
jgi:hypothetical protein